MLKFPADGGIVTIRSTILIPTECATVITSSKEIPKEAGVRHENFKVALHPNFPNQEVAIGGMLSAKGRTELCSLLKENLDIFAWQLSDMTGVLRSVAEHRLNIREGYSPVRQNKRGQASKRARAIQAEVQRLNGKLVSLNRFLSKSAEKSLPPFKTLKKCIKKSDFHWTSEAKQAFKQLKQHLSELPLLVAPKPKEELIVYLSASYEDISAVLMTDRGMVQMPVYFVIRALQGPELIYTPMEKLVLSLVFATKRLKRYFQAHPIAVITDQPIKQIMSRPDVAGRLQKWSVMLGEHNITYRPRTSVKGQVLADFLAEMPDESPPDASVVEAQQEPSWRNTQRKSIQEKEVTTVVEEDGPTWMTPIIEYLKEGTLPSDRKEARKLHYVIREIHEGSCSMHVGPQSVVAKAIRLGYYWPTMHRDARDMIPNRSLREGIKARLGERNKNWVEELPHVLWAHRTMIKSRHGDTPFSLTYGTEAIIPAKIGMPTYHTAAVDVVHNDEEPRLNLDLLEERRKRAAIHEAKAKLKMTKYYNARVRGFTFRPGDFVYRSNDTSHAVDGGKLGSKWEVPYEVTEALGDGAYKLGSMDGTVLPRTWNIANLKKCYL
nr:reverse transcriptase domain-containing protein [Tanacetum cinerariifolium]